MASHASRTGGNGRDPIPAPWVLVGGGFHRHGGMDKANAALAAYLLERQTPLHLVAHQVDPELCEHPGATVHLVPRPLGSFFLGEWPLERRGRSVARDVTARWPGTRVLVNGGCCDWPDINWVHCVHHAWRCHDRGIPPWLQVKNRLIKSWARRRERSVIRRARVVLANSERTRRDLAQYLGLASGGVHVVYPGTDPAWGPATAEERAAARSWLGRSPERPLVVFVGILGGEGHKGFDTLWSAWRALCIRPDWDADLIVAGGGSGLGRLRREVAAARLEDRVHLLGFTHRVAELLAAADLLVSPARYEAFGLNVQEAICRGVPALVTSSAGVAERYPSDLADMMLPDPENVDDLVARLLRWRSSIDCWKDRFRPLATALRNYTWTDMASRIVSLAEESDTLLRPPPDAKLPPKE